MTRATLKKWLRRSGLAGLAVGVSAVAMSPAFACSSLPILTASPARAEAGAVVQLQGESFDPNGSSVSLYWGGAANGILLASTQANQSGAFSQTVTIPANATEGSSYLVQAAQKNATDQVTATANLVFEIGPVQEAAPTAPAPASPTTADPQPGAATQPTNATQPAPAQPAPGKQPVSVGAPAPAAPPAHTAPAPPARTVQGPLGRTVSVPAQRKPSVTTPSGERTALSRRSLTLVAAPLHARVPVPRVASPPQLVTAHAAAPFIGPRAVVAPLVGPVVGARPAAPAQSLQADPRGPTTGSGPPPWILVPLALLGVVLSAGSTAAFIHELRTGLVRANI